MLQMVRTTIFVSVFLLACEGFLIDGNTPPVPTDGSILTDTHYNFLMQFIIQERQSRLRLETMFTNLQQQLAATQTDLTGKIKVLEKCGAKSKHRIQTLETNLLASNTSIESALNTLSSHLTSLSTAINFNKRSIQNTREIISNRVVLSAWAGGGIATNGHTIPFTSVITSHGINDLTSMKNLGKFTCEKTGYYLITFFFATNTATGRMCIYVNGGAKACASKHADTNFQTHTAIYLDHINVHDTVDVRVTGASLYVWNGVDSMFSVLQVV